MKLKLAYLVFGICTNDSSIGNTRSISQIVLSAAARKFAFISDHDQDTAGVVAIKRL